jgi:hypothetical protein
MIESQLVVQENHGDCSYGSHSCSFGAGTGSG